MERWHARGTKQLPSEELNKLITRVIASDKEAWRVRRMTSQTELTRFRELNRFACSVPSVGTLVLIDGARVDTMGMFSLHFISDCIYSCETMSCLKVLNFSFDNNTTALSYFKPVW